jgi:hypothetical protein
LFGWVLDDITSGFLASVSGPVSGPSIEANIFHSQLPGFAIYCIVYMGRFDGKFYRIYIITVLYFEFRTDKKCVNTMHEYYFGGLSYSHFCCIVFAQYIKISLNFAVLRNKIQKINISASISCHW